MVEAFELLTVIGSAAVLLLSFVVIASGRARRQGDAYGTAAVGAVYEWHNRDQQKALDTIVDGKPAERRPEYPDGDLPKLAHPRADQE